MIASALPVISVFLLLAAPASAQILTRVQASPTPIAGFSVQVAPAGFRAPGALTLSIPSLAAPAVAVSPALSALPVALQAAPRFQAAPAGPIAAYVLDLDGNAFGPGFPTKIILFRKGGREELPVSTARFAVIERSIGKDVPYDGVNLKDYELRGDASFREFFGPKFAADLRYAVENLPASQWQGPSWGAMVRALSDPVIAAHTYVLTARQHSPEQLLDGFRYLQAAGYIRHLPKVENLHGVGGTHRTAERKAELMADFIDSLQAAPLGADGGRHAIGFSDDTWANHEKMRDALTAILRREPGRWSKVKIVLFFTGAADPRRRPEALVVNDDGTTRPYLPGEPR